MSKLRKVLPFVYRFTCTCKRNLTMVFCEEESDIDCVALVCPNCTTTLLIEFEYQSIKDVSPVDGQSVGIARLDSLKRGDRLN